jgi:hypothetical protein
MFERLNEKSWFGMPSGCSRIPLAFSLVARRLNICSTFQGTSANGSARRPIARIARSLPIFALKIIDAWSAGILRSRVSSQRKPPYPAMSKDLEDEDDWGGRINGQRPTVRTITLKEGFSCEPGGVNLTLYLRPSAFFSSSPHL